jgi:hypothetical protein
MRVAARPLSIRVGPIPRNMTRKESDGDGRSGDAPTSDHARGVLRRRWRGHVFESAPKKISKQGPVPAPRGGGGGGAGHEERGGGGPRFGPAEEARQEWDFSFGSTRQHGGLSQRETSGRRRNTHNDARKCNTDYDCAASCACCSRRSHDPAQGSIAAGAVGLARALDEVAVDRHVQGGPTFAAQHAVVVAIARAGRRL